MARLIDANELWQKVFSHTYPVKILDNENKVLNEVLRLIDNAPTVEERQKGKWLAKEDMDYLDKNKVAHIHFMCEKCGFIHDFIDGHTSQYNFCPNCGADMREAYDE